jgi:hypothetical protein
MHLAWERVWVVRFVNVAAGRVDDAMADDEAGGGVLFDGYDHVCVLATHRVADGVLLKAGDKAFAGAGDGGELGVPLAHHLGVSDDLRHSGIPLRARLHNHLIHRFGHSVGPCPLDNLKSLLASMP